MVIELYTTQMLFLLILNNRKNSTYKCTKMTLSMYQIHVILLIFRRSLCYKKKHILQSFNDFEILIPFEAKEKCPVSQWYTYVLLDIVKKIRYNDFCQVHLNRKLQ